MKTANANTSLRMSGGVAAVENDADLEISAPKRKDADRVTGVPWVCHRMRSVGFALAAIVFLSAFAIPSPVCASTSSSANYTVVTDALDHGGAPVSSANYTATTSVGSIGAPGTTTDYLGKGGYQGQLYDVVGLVASAASSTVNETASVQLGASGLLDDSTLLALSPSSVSWGIGGGPIQSIDVNGLATASAVYQNTNATATAAYGGFNDSTTVTVLDTIPDNFGTYAGDGLPDDWQAQYFGLNNPKAAPGVDASGTGQNNQFKYVAGLDPTDPSAVFRTMVRHVSGQAGQKQVVFGPVYAGRNYTVVSDTRLDGGPSFPLSNATWSDNGTTRTVTDLGATEARKFYRVQISKP